jgi:DNA recombination protein RmuC
MELVLLVIGVMMGAAASGLVTRARLAAREVEHQRQRELVEAARDDALERAEAAERRENDLKLDVANVQGEHREQLATLRTQLDGVRREGEEKVRLLNDAQETMRAVLKDAAGEAFEGSGKKVVDLATAALRTATAENREAFERERQNVEQLVEPMKEGLGKLGVAVDKLDRDRERQHAELGEQMRGMMEGQVQVREEAAVLSRALYRPHTRGQWGEFSLRRVVEMAGLSPYCDFDEQPHVNDDGRVQRPDMVVHLPGGKDVVVDSKAPLGPYMEACEATDPKVRDSHMRLFTRGLRAHVKRLGSKNYEAQFESAPDFVVMYVPGEHFFAAAVDAERSLLEDAVRDRVLIATPVTLIALLKTVAYTWQQEKVAETARDIAQLGCTLYERLCTYLKHVEKEGRLIRSLMDAHNAAVGSLDHSVLPAARRFPELGAVGSDKQLPGPRDVSGSVRSVKACELSDGSVDETPTGGHSLTSGPEKDALSGEIASVELPESRDDMEAA